MSAPRAVHVTTGHRPFDTRVFQKECRTLAAAGYEVVLVCPHDHDEVVDGVRIVAIPRPASRFRRLVVAPWIAMRTALRQGHGVVHVHDPGLLPVALVLSLLGRTVVYDSHEDVPRLVVDRPWIPAGLRRPFAWLVAALERMTAARVALIVSAEEEGARRFPPARTVVVRNHVLLDEFPRPDPDRTRAPDVVYVGDLTRQRGIVSLVDAMGRLPDRHAGSRLLLGGPFSSPGLAAELAALPGWQVTEALGWVGRGSVGGLLGGATVGAVLWHPTRKHAEGAVPVKLFEYMAAGLAVLASDLPVLREVVDSTGCGVLVDPLDVDAVAAALAGLLDDPSEAAAMGLRGREAVERRYEWSAEGHTLLAAYGGLQP